MKISTLASVTIAALAAATAADTSVTRSKRREDRDGAIDVDTGSALDRQLAAAYAFADQTFVLGSMAEVDDYLLGVAFDEDDKTGGGAMFNDDSFGGDLAALMGAAAGRRDTTYDPHRRSGQD